jgi:virginiamycin B lyase
MPLAVEVDGDQVWYVSTKQGILGSYNIADARFEKENVIPSWPARSAPTSYSMSWAAKADDNGNIWFTDERQKALWKFNKSAQTFEVFSVPANLPAGIDFDSDGNIYFIGVQSRSIFVGDVSAMKNGTSEGITEIALPLEGFQGIESNLITTGSLVVDKVNNDVWLSLLAFQQKGQLFKYDLDADRVEKIVDLPSDLSSPVGITLDSSGNVWVTDHGTNIFFKYDKVSGEITKFVTSVASPRIYGGTTPPNAYTLPYWIEMSPDDGALWFNQHTGNKMARFDPENLVLTEYWIPSQNGNWAAGCLEGSTDCGLANGLQFSSGANGQVWFTEWTQNKVGRVDANKQVPISVNVPQSVTVARGGVVEIKVEVNGSLDFAGKMMASSSLTPTGALGNAGGIFSEESVSVASGGSKTISFTFSPSEAISQGKYVIMLGAGNDDISVMKAVQINVV